MESLSIKGGVPLHGEVTIGGAKNAVLPIMAATLLTAEPCVIRRVPNLSDVTFMGQILTSLGAKVKFNHDTLEVEATRVKGVGDYDLIRKMRGSICILGPLIGRLRRARVSLPGGCVIGPRPIDLHLKGLNQLGARITVEGGYIRATAPRLAGGDVFLGGRAGPTVLGTANVMMAAVLAEGVTLLEARPDHMHAVLDKLRESGVKVERRGNALTVRRGGRLKPADITTLPYAGFPTDAQAQMMVLMTLTPGISIITERIFESRFMHVSELARLGADIAIEGPSAIVKGGRPLSGAPIMASDLRASAALVIAGLVARGSTLVKRIYHLDRGYEKIDEKLKALGARIERVEEA